jgi:GxxExxY protein
MESNQHSPLLLNDVTGKVIGAFYDVYNELAGFPEFVLRRGMVIALQDSGLVAREEVELSVWFRGRRITKFRADLIVDPGLIVEVKAAPELQPFHKAQLSHYLKATDLELGLVLNFGRRPEFARVIYQHARNQRRAEVPPAVIEALSEGQAQVGEE